LPARRRDSSHRNATVWRARRNSLIEMALALKALAERGGGYHEARPPRHTGPRLPGGSILPKSHFQKNRGARGSKVHFPRKACAFFVGGGVAARATRNREKSERSPPDVEQRAGDRSISNRSLRLTWTKIERSGRSVARTLTAALIVVALHHDIRVGAAEEALQARLTRIAEMAEPKNVLNRL
jgi:hypothetical protein